MQHRAYSILMVDDDEDDIFAVRRGFMNASLDITVLAVTSAASLFEQLNDSSRVMPDLILLDINMPRMNGFEALEQLKANKNWAEIPVMILSTSEHDGDRQTAKRLGAMAFETKFSSMKSLDKWIQRVEQFLVTQF